MRHVGYNRAIPLNRLSAQGPVYDPLGLPSGYPSGLSLTAPSSSVIINRWLSRTEAMIGVVAVVDHALGVLPYCTSLEDAWRNNKPDDPTTPLEDSSCIPSGIYICRRWKSTRYDTFEVTNVPGRSAILIHGGNTQFDTRGCILLGSSYGVINSQPAVTASQAVFKAFMQYMGGVAEFTLEIRDIWGGSTALRS